MKETWPEHRGLRAHAAANGTAGAKDTRIGLVYNVEGDRPRVDLWKEKGGGGTKEERGEERRGEGQESRVRRGSPSGSAGEGSAFRKARTALLLAPSGESSGLDLAERPGLGLNRGREEGNGRNGGEGKRGARKMGRRGEKSRGLRGERVRLRERA